MSVNIAIDGPAGAGKSTIAKACAAKLGYVYVDTGAMYRSIALYMIKHGIDVSDENLVSSNVSSVALDISYADGEQRIFLNKIDVTGKIRTPEVSAAASAVSAYKKVRESLLSMQRDIAAKENVIMDGRDIGTTILPNADIKIYLTASADVRGNRRYKELTEKGIKVDLESVINDVKKRDEADLTRAVSPLRMASDAILIDSSDMTIDQVVDKIVNYVNGMIKK
jgi:cytidylate kinase